MSSYGAPPPPSTPPRKGRSSRPPVMIKSPVNLRTPQTQTLKKVKDFFATPGSHTKGANGPRTRGKDNGLMPITPDFTPQKSPRVHRRKRSYIEDIFKTETATPSSASSISSTCSNLSLHNQDNLGFLLPTPSTVGSGRKFASNSNFKIKPAALKFDTLSKLNDNLKFESDDEEQIEDLEAQDSTISDADDFFLRPGGNKSQGNDQFVLNSNLLKSPTQICHQPSSPTKLFEKSHIPQTPLKQLIDDDKINNWHGKSMKYLSDEDIPEDELNHPKQLINPFLNESTDAKEPATKRNINVNNPFNVVNDKSDSTGEIDYSTHAEFIHNKTGEKKIVRLLERQANIKPKKLNFSSAL